MPKFSIIIPTYNRADGRLQRALDSVAIQTYCDFECVVVDDGSTDKTQELLEHELHPRHPRSFHHFCYVKHDQRQGRVIARNTGMAAAEGEWICWLDSDDCLDSMYLATFAHNIEQNHDARLWVCGVVVHGQVGKPNERICPKWTKIRPAWMPPVSSNGNHMYFDSGHVGTGMFVFHRECYEELGPLPDWKHPDDISDGIDEWLGLPFGTLGYGSGKKEREVDTPPLVRKRGIGHVGNPYGEDHAFFQALALRWSVNLIHAALYVQYVR